MQSLPSAVGYTDNQAPVMGRPADNYPINNQGFNANPNNQIPVYAGDGYYNPDRVAIVNLRRGRKKVLISFLIIFILAISIFILLKMMVFSH